MPPALTSALASQRRYPIRIPIRMTRRERAVIGKRACSLNRSISRYLVELATAGPVGATPEDRARLTFLYALFQSGIEKVQTTLDLPVLSPEGGAEVRQARASLLEVARLLEVIGHEVRRRIE